jgi:hypothetical protein
MLEFRRMGMGISLGRGKRKTEGISNHTKLLVTFAFTKLWIVSQCRLLHHSHSVKRLLTFRYTIHCLARCPTTLPARWRR